MTKAFPRCTHQIEFAKEWKRDASRRMCTEALHSFLLAFVFGESLWFTAWQLSPQEKRIFSPTLFVFIFAEEVGNRNSGQKKKSAGKRFGKKKKEKRLRVKKSQSCTLARDKTFSNFEAFLFSFLEGAIKIPPSDLHPLLDAGRAFSFLFRRSLPLFSTALIAPSYCPHRILVSLLKLYGSGVEAVEGGGETVK